MQINIEDIDQLVKDADKIFLSPEGEKELVKLLNIRKQVDEAIELAEKKLEEAALKINPNFSSIQSDKVKVYYRAYGAQYYLDETQINLTPKELYTTESKVVYKIDSKLVEKWVDQHKGMPAGIKEVERIKQLKFKLKDDGKDKEE